MAGGNDVFRLHKLPCFAIVNDKQVGFLQDIEQPRAGDAHPQIHGVGHDEGGMVYLGEGVDLVVRAAVGQQDELRGAGCGRQFWLKSFQNIQSDRLGFPLIHVLKIFARPPERLAVDHFNAVGADLPGPEQIKISRWKIASDNTHQFHR